MNGTMKRRGARARAAGAALVAALAVTACGGSGSADAPADSGSTAAKESRPALLAIPAPSLNFLPYLMATERDLGFYEKHGVDLTVEVIRGDAALAGMIQGSVDFTAAGGTAMRAAFNGAPVRAIMMTVGETTFSVVATDDITDVSDLRGRTVGLVGSGLADTTGVALRAVLESEGMDPEKDVQIFVAATPPDIFSALIGGSIDAAVLAPPQSVAAIDKGFVEVTRASDHLELTQGQIGATVALIEEEPDFVKAFLAATLDAIEYVVTNEEEVVAYIQERFELEENVARDSYDILRDAYLLDGLPSDAAALGELPAGATKADLARTVDFSLLKQLNEER
jgi:ABC-type nitrate/sulfonate/bicarbonate transport system substrate-binding protein